MRNRVKITMSISEELNFEELETDEFYKKEDKVLDKITQSIKELSSKSSYEDCKFSISKRYIEWPKPYKKPPYIVVVVDSNGLAEKDVLDQIDPVSKKAANSVYEKFNVKDVMIEGIV